MFIAIREVHLDLKTVFVRSFLNRGHKIRGSRKGKRSSDGLHPDRLLLVSLEEIDIWKIVVKSKNSLLK